eukprot:TRINITY_DN2820_c0_g1_i2.p1 TRINITY_DN2820_c0_g1~~TRINITY_DN2820_c0_g1_i2.p1  ORF type:complete len:254 (-),score=25.79 TRINITY_DN2820_c0_g1_i2:316-1077(-)
MSKSLHFVVFLVTLSCLISLSLCGSRGGSSSSRSSSFSSRSSSFSSSYRSSSYYRSYFGYRSYSYSYYYYYYNYYDSMGVEAPPPPPFCEAAISPLGSAKVNISTSSCYPVFLPTSVDYLTPFTDFAPMIETAISQYLTLNVILANLTVDSRTSFFDQCTNEIIATVCASYYVDCFNSAQTPCTNACAAMNACRDNVFQKANITLVNNYASADCGAYPACKVGDHLCCWGISSGSMVGLSVVALLVAMVVSMW